MGLGSRPDLPPATHLGMPLVHGRFFLSPVQLGCAWPPCSQPSSQPSCTKSGLSVHPAAPLCEHQASASCWDNATVPVCRSSCCFRAKCSNGKTRVPRLPVRSVGASQRAPSRHSIKCHTVCVGQSVPF